MVGCELSVIAAQSHLKSEKNKADVFYIKDYKKDELMYNTEEDIGEDYDRD